MAADKRPVTSVVHTLRWLLLTLLSCCSSYGTKTDYECLQKVKNSLHDPNGYLSNWNFTNMTEGSICGFNGVECWHPTESRVFLIKLTGMGLQGHFPLGLVYCSSMTGLFLSGNSLNGSLPSNISEIIGYVTSLDLSDNDFSGEIPEDLANCPYLNLVNLARNRFSGQIPLQLGNLSRLGNFNVADNNLSGQIPDFIDSATITKGDFSNNPGLCGQPLLDSCAAPAEESNLHLAYKVGGVTACFFFVATVALFASKSKKKDVKKKVDDPAVDKWLLSTKVTKAIKVSMFDKTVPKMTWGDIMKATDNFSINNIIGSEMTGTMYKATLLDGALLMVKRLQNSHQTKTEFESDMTALDSLKHPNLVPLLGFCIIKKERFLVYKYMLNGNLYDQLHPSDPEPSILGWPLRLQIAIGVAKGLLWLEQNRIHGKVSLKSILLDHDFEAKLYELGLARITNLSQAHFSTFARGQIGDLGILVPEYSNVYAFGTVLLELITGQKPFQMNNASKNFKGSLVEWVHQLPRTSSDDLYSVIDKSLLEEGSAHELFQFMSVACSCVSSVPKERPTMFRVYGLLKAIGEGHNFSDNGDGDL